MNEHKDMNERDVDRLLQGRANACEADAGVAAFFEGLRTSNPEASTEHCEHTHLSAMFHEAHLITDKGEPVVRPASKADGPAAQVSGLPMWRESVMVRFSGLSVGARIAAAATLLVFAFTGVAVAGGLPRPVQHAVSHAASVIGVTIPDPDDATEIEAPEVDDTQDAVEPSEVESNDQGQEQLQGTEQSDNEQDDQDEAVESTHDGAKADADDENDTENDAEEARSSDDSDEHEAAAPSGSETSDHESDDTDEPEAGADD